MKRFLSVLILLCLCALPAFAEEPAVPFELEEIVGNLLDQPWIGEVGGILETVSHETYEEVILGRAPGDGRDEAEPAARVLVDRATGLIAGYRRQDYEMPAIPKTDMLWERDAVKRFGVALSEIGATAGDAVAYLEGADASVGFLWAPDEHTGFYADCGDHGNASSLLIMRSPEGEGTRPVLLAYVNLFANPQIGYDGCLSAGEAADAGRAALREAFGGDVAEHVEVDVRSFILYDKVLMIETDGTGDVEALENSMNRIWVIRFLDPRGDIRGAGFVPGFEEAYEYRIVLDAVSGELILMEGPWDFGLG